MEGELKVGLNPATIYCYSNCELISTFSQGVTLYPLNSGEVIHIGVYPLKG